MFVWFFFITLYFTLKMLGCREVHLPEAAGDEAGVSAPSSSSRWSVFVWEALVCSWCSGTLGCVSLPGPGQMCGRSEGRSHTLDVDWRLTVARESDPDAWSEWRPRASAASYSSYAEDEDMDNTQKRDAMKEILPSQIKIISNTHATDRRWSFFPLSRFKCV